MKSVNKDIPLFILLKALGFVSDKDILECIFNDLTDTNVHGKSLRHLIEFVKPSLDLVGSMDTEESCLFWLGTKSIDEK